MSTHSTEEFNAIVAATTERGRMVMERAMHWFKGHPDHRGNAAYLAACAKVDALTAQGDAQVKAGEAEFAATIEAARKLRPKTGRKQKPNLNESELEPLLRAARAKWVPIVDAITIEREVWKRIKFLIGETVEPEPLPDRMDRVWFASTSSYGSQTDCHGYAKGELKPLEDKLRSMEFKTHVRFVPTSQSRLQVSGYYELWADMDERFVDAVRSQITEREEVRSRGSLNPWVYSPAYDGPWPIH